MNECIGWKGPCPSYGDLHGCDRPDGHPGVHRCVCGVESHTATNPEPRKYTRRQREFYYPKYMQRKRS